MTKLQSYHLVWLSSHPNRTEQWLRDRLADGFHVHHIDGDHDNDDSDNLVLIEGRDHLALHGMDVPAMRRRAGSNTNKRKRISPEGLLAYEKRERGHKWLEIGRYAHDAARRYAKRTGRTWPPIMRDAPIG